MTDFQPIETAPKDGTKILAWCVHEADEYFFRVSAEDGPLSGMTTYAAHIEMGGQYAANGYNIIEWGGAFDDSTHEYSGASLPDWWYVAGTEHECAANPTHWVPLPSPPQTRADLLTALKAAADYINSASDRFDGHDTEGFHYAEVAEKAARAAILKAEG